MRTSGMKPADIKGLEREKRENVKNKVLELRANTATDPPLHWWEPLVKQASRVWKSLDHRWCIPQHSKELAQHYENRPRDVARAQRVDGLVFIKSPKAASSTGSGISLRIATEVGRRKHNMTCTVNYTHPFAFYRGHAKRSESSLLWTVVREPAKRELSVYNFVELTRNGVNASDVISRNVTDFLASQKGSQFRYIARKRFGAEDLERRSKSQKEELVRNLLQFYHFVAIAERMDESLVVMRMLFNLHHRDLIVMPSKVGVDSKTCRPIERINFTEETNAFIQTNFTVDNIDYLLYEAANLSLDATINMLGRQRVESQVKEHKRLQALAERNCMKSVPRCSTDTRSEADNECYWHDSGCAFRCVDRVLRHDAVRRASV